MVIRDGHGVLTNTRIVGFHFDTRIVGFHFALDS